MGGECPYWGCVPSKMMIRAADLLAEGAPDPRHGRRLHGRARLGPGGPAGSGTRRPTTGTTRWPRSGSTGKGGRLFRGWGRIAGPAGRGRRRTCSRRAGAGSSSATGTAPCDPADGRAGRHAVLDQPRGHRDRGGAGVAGRPGRRRHRRRAGPGVPPVRRRGHRGRGRWPGCSARRSPRPARCSPRCSAGEGIDVRTGGAGRRRSHHDGARVRGRRSPTAPGWSATGCWWPPAAGPTWPRSGRGVDRPRRAGPRLPVDDHMRVTRSAALGAWATSSARAPSPTCRCTRPTSWSADILGQEHHGRPTTGPCPGSPSPTPRSASVGLTEAAGPGAGLTRPGRHRRRSPTSTRGWIHKAGNDGFIKLVEDADRGGAGRRHLGRARGAARCSACSPWPSTPRVPAQRLRRDDLRLPDLPPRHRGRLAPPGLIQPSADHRPARSRPPVTPEISRW